MRSFKKALIAVVLMFVITIGISLTLIEPLYHSEFVYYNDAKLRSDLAGTLDYLFVGASNGYAAFVPPIADAEMNISSYNLSGGLLTWYGRRTLLEKELSRNPVKTVVLEISYNSFIREYHSAQGDAFLMCRMDSPAERLQFLFRKTSFADWDHIYANILGNSINYMVARVQNAVLKKDVSLKNVDYAVKGYHAKHESYLVTEAMLHRGVGQMDTYFIQKNLDEFYGIVDLCKSKGIEVLFVVVPISDYEIYRFDNWDVLAQKWAELSKKTDCPLIDFNLLKDRYTLFRDADSFADKVHLSETGARAFTKAYGTVMDRFRSGEDVSDLFYPDYASMRADSPYLSE